MRTLLLSTLFCLFIAPYAGAERVAYFAGGCFWCMQPPFDKTTGVTKTVAGYMGGHVDNPTYEIVSAGNSGHSEAIAVYYDETKISYRQLLEIYWRNIDPIDPGGQFCDRGDSYKSVIFFTDKSQEEAAIQSRENLQKHFSKITTKILPAKQFYPAEKYHQNYYKKNPLRYKFYRYRCGRDARLKELWGKQ